MIVIISALTGVLIGWTTARRRKGNRLDMLQYAAGYAIAFAIIGIFLTLLVERIVAT